MELPGTSASMHEYSPCTWIHASGLPLDICAREIEVARPTASSELDISAPVNGNTPMSVLTRFVAPYLSVPPLPVTTCRGMSAQVTQLTASATAVYTKLRLRSDADIVMPGSGIPSVGSQAL